MRTDFAGKTRSERARRPDDKGPKTPPPHDDDDDDNMADYQAIIALSIMRFTFLPLELKRAFLGEVVVNAEVESSRRPPPFAAIKLSQSTWHPKRNHKRNQNLARVGFTFLISRF